MQVALNGNQPHALDGPRVAFRNRNDTRLEIRSRVRRQRNGE
jgi:hypothetical protein